MKFEEEISSVARRYREDSFNLKEGWRRLGIARTGWRSFKKIAAAIAVSAVLCATAGIYVYHSANTVTETEPASPIQPPRYVVRTIDFNDVPLGTVLEKIREIYDVELDNVPVNADDFRLTLRYEGNADDLIDTINDIFGTDIKIRQ